MITSNKLCISLLLILISTVSSSREVIEEKVLHAITETSKIKDVWSLAVYKEYGNGNKLNAEIYDTPHPIDIRACWVKRQYFLINQKSENEFKVELQENHLGLALQPCDHVTSKTSFSDINLKNGKFPAEQEIGEIVDLLYAAVSKIDTKNTTISFSDGDEKLREAFRQLQPSDLLLVVNHKSGAVWANFYSPILRPYQITVKIDRETQGGINVAVSLNDI